MGGKWDKLHSQTFHIKSFCSVQEMNEAEISLLSAAGFDSGAPASKSFSSINVFCMSVSLCVEI